MQRVVEIAVILVEIENEDGAGPDRGIGCQRLQNLLGEGAAMGRAARRAGT